MFWVISGIIIVILLSIYFTLSSVAGGPVQFSEISEDKILEMETFLTENFECKVSFPYLRDYIGSRSRDFSIPSKTKVTVLSEKSIGNDLLEITIEGRIDGQLVTFWIREGFKSTPDDALTTPFILYLRGDGSYSDITKEESLLARTEFSLVVPYILSESSTIGYLTTTYTNNPVTFQTYVLAEVLSIVDYIAVVYNDPKIIIYGEAWGSVLGRELGLVDTRIDLVISNKFAGDPNGTLLENGFYLEEASVNKVYLQDSVRCLPRGVTNFIDLVPSPHIYLGPSIYNNLYSVGTKDLAGFLENKYLGLGLEDQFTYIELENLDNTYNEEVLNSIYENLISVD